MKIAVDIDGVIADLHSEWLYRYNRDYNDTLKVERITTWDMHPWVKEECGYKIYNYLSDPDLYKHVTPIRGAAGGVARLRRLGHEIVFASSCGVGGVMIDQKCHWLPEHGFVSPPTRGIVPPELIVAEDKLNVDADLLIDDRGETVDQWVEKKRKRAFLYESPWNGWLQEAKHSSFWLFCTPVKGWQEIIQKMEEL